MVAPFDDLYTVVYALIDDAKTRHRVIKLHKGSHGSPDPHPVVLGYGEVFAAYRRGVLGFACDRVRPGADLYRVADLDEFDGAMRPRVPTRAVFELLARTGRRTGETDDEYLTYLATRAHQLGAYRGGSSGLDDESRAFMAAYFQQQEIPATPGEVLIFSGGFKGALIATCAALMSVRHHDELRHVGGRVLAPVGYYQSLRLIPTIFGGHIDVVSELDGDTVSGWLAGAEPFRSGGRIVYVPLVNNMNGHVLNRDRAASIAAAVLDHNEQHPGEPVWVVADHVYEGSYLDAGLSPQPIGALPGMGECTVTVTTPSKTVALPTARVAYATTTNPGLRGALAHYRTVFSFGRVPQSGELTGVAALCLTPQTWIEDWNAEYRRRPVAERVAGNLKALRELRGLSYRELSRTLDALGRKILPTGLVKIEDGSRRVDVDDLVALALALRVPLPRLLMPGANTGGPVELTGETSLDFTDAWRWARGELLPGVPPKPDGEGWVKVDNELLGYINLGHPDLFDQGPLSINEYQTHLSAVVHARVAEIENVRFRPRKRGEKVED